MLKRQLQALLDRSRFLRPYRFRVVAVKKGKCTLELRIARSSSGPAESSTARR